ncbi:MAG: DnaA/Hda family protein [Fibromonadales bacterium]|nr:DnaA/Hda family protein [Fibromonadales bacterium]
MNAAKGPVLNLWEQCLSAFLRSNPKENDSWLSAIKHISAENGTLCIEAANEFAKELFLCNFCEAFLKIAQSIDPCINKISIFAPQIKEEKAEAPELKKPERAKLGNFCKKYKLDNFIAETSNEFALECAKIIAAKPSEQDNFLVIKGAEGLGKTHLLHAIGNSASWAKKAVLWDAERFLKERSNGNLALYQADILLFDNLQDIYNLNNQEFSQKVQNEFLNILKTLKNKGRSIVIAVNPKSKNAPAADFENFLKMGIKCEIKKPDLRTRIAILRQKAQEKGLPAASLEDCWKLIAEKFGENVCSLEGIINELAARQTHLKCEITPQIIRSIYGEKNTGSKDPTMKSIATAAALAYNIPMETLCGKSRIAKVSKPRQIAIYLCKQTGLSLSEIGKFFNRDASSIANAVQSVKNKISGKTGYSYEFEIMDILNAARK